MATSNYSNNLLALPKEIFAYLLSFLDLDTMSNLEKSSRELKKRFVSENIWENHARSLYHKGRVEARWMRGVLFKPDAKVKIPGRRPHRPDDVQVYQYIDGKFSDSVCITWALPINRTSAKIVSFEMYLHKETKIGVPSDIQLWDNCYGIEYTPIPIPDVTSDRPVFGRRLKKDEFQFKVRQKYHFSLRAEDSYGRFGPFSEPKRIIIKQKKKGETADQ